MLAIFSFSSRVRFVTLGFPPVRLAAADEEAIDSWGRVLPGVINTKGEQPGPSK